MEKSKDSQKKHVSPQRIMATASAFYDSCILFTASDLGIFARVSEHERADAAAIADMCGLDRAVLPSLNLAGREKLLDVGGGPGTYSMLIARRSPEIECTVLDLPEIARVADELILAERMQDRVKTLAGDYRAVVFPGHNDVVIFFGVLHQESADSIIALLKKAYRAMVPGGIIYVLDMMTDATRTRPKFSSLFAVNMALTAQNGWVFSDKDLESWVAEAGLRDFSCLPLPPPMPHWLASARKP